MFESNFPVDLGSCTYDVLWNAFKLIAAGYSADEKTALFSGAATRFYRLALWRALPSRSSNSMAAPPRPLTETRREQMFPVLEPAQVDRLRRFGQRRSFADGEFLVRVGEVGHGLVVILAGKVDVIQHRD